MKKTYHLENLDCANCAMKIARIAKKNKGVNDVQVEFINNCMIIDWEVFDANQEQKLCQKIERLTDVEVGA